MCWSIGHTGRLLFAARQRQQERQGSSHRPCIPRAFLQLCRWVWLSDPAEEALPHGSLVEKDLSYLTCWGNGSWFLYYNKRHIKKMIVEYINLIKMLCPWTLIIHNRPVPQIPPHSPASLNPVTIKLVPTTIPSTVITNSVPFNINPINVIWSHICHQNYIVCNQWKIITDL